MQNRPWPTHLRKSAQQRQDNIDEYTNEQGRSNQSTPGQEPPEEDDSPITNTTPNPTKSNVIKRTRRHHAVPWSPAGDLITIYESENEIKLEENPVGTHTPHRRRAGDRDCETAPTVRRRLMLDDQTPLVEKTRLSTSSGEPAQNLPTPPAESTPSPAPRAPAPVSPDGGTSHPTQTPMATRTEAKQQQHRFKQQKPRRQNNDKHPTTRG